MQSSKEFNNKDQSYSVVIQKSHEKLKDEIVAERLMLHNILYENHSKGALFKMLGKDYVLTSDFDILDAATGDTAGFVEQILILHYIENDIAFTTRNKMISFRELPGGAFYWRPFVERSTGPLAGKIGNDVEKLENSVKRYSCKRLDYGDFSVAIHIIGNVFINLVYWCGDEEFPAKADITFDDSIRLFYNTDDVAALASYVCFDIVKHI